MILHYAIDSTTEIAFFFWLFINYWTLNYRVLEFYYECFHVNHLRKIGMLMHLRLFTEEEKNLRGDKTVYTRDKRRFYGVLVICSLLRKLFKCVFVILYNTQTNNLHEKYKETYKSFQGKFHQQQMHEAK